MRRWATVAGRPPTTGGTWVVVISADLLELARAAEGDGRDRPDDDEDDDRQRARETEVLLGRPVDARDRVDHRDEDVRVPERHRRVGEARASPGEHVD